MGTAPAFTLLRFVAIIQRLLTKFFNSHQEFTPGNSPRASTVEAEPVGKEVESVGKEAEPVGKEAESKLESDHTHQLMSSSPAHCSPLVKSLSPNRTTTGSSTGLTGVDQEKQVFHYSLMLGRDRDRITTELKENATFSPSEETASAGCGQLESSSRQQDTPDSLTPTQASLSEVKVRSKSPPPISLDIGPDTSYGVHHANSDLFTSPAKCEFS